jgi:hypothetical protein
MASDQGYKSVPERKIMFLRPNDFNFAEVRNRFDNPFTFKLMIVD